ncbi:MAG: hypothetical protein QXS00_07940 [Pyrobaculum sp.]
MQEAVSLPLMVLIAALMVAVGGLVVWHFQDAQKVADWGEAYVYPLARPYNATHFWLGAQAAFADVEVGRVAVDGAEYLVSARLQYGRQAWLNYSGQPLLARCNSTVAYEVRRGSASRVLTFKAVCPQGEVKSAYIEDVNQILREMNAYASFVFNYLEFLNTSVLAVDVVDDGRTAYIAIYNTWKWPLFIYAARFDWQDLPWYGSWIASPTPPGPWGLMFNISVPSGYSVNEYVFHFAGTLMPGDYIKIWPFGEVWYRPPWASGYPDNVTLAVAYTAFITDSFGYVNGKIFPKNGSVVVVKNPQYVGSTYRTINKDESPTIILRFDNKTIITYDVHTTMEWTSQGGFLVLRYDYKNLSNAGSTTVRISFDAADYYKLYQAWPSYGTGYYPVVIYAFPAMPVAANASSAGPPYLEIGGKTAYGEQVVKGVAGLSPVRVYAVEARNNYTHWLVSAGVPGYGIALNESVLTAVARPGGSIAVEVSTGYVRIKTPDGRVYERKTPYWTDPEPGFATYKSPIVAYLTPDAQYWVAIAGYRASGKALLLKSNAELTCQRVGPNTYIMSLGSTCEGAGAVIKYYLESFGPPADARRLRFDVYYRVSRNLLWPAVVYRMQVPTDDPKAFFDQFSKIRAVWVEMVNGTYARAYVKDYPGNASSLPDKPLDNATLAKNGTQFSVPVLYDISPRGIEPYVLYVSTDADLWGRCVGNNRVQYYSQFGTDLYYKGKLVSYYKQALSVVKIESCSGSSQPVVELSVPPVCGETVMVRFVGNQTQRNTRPNPDGTYYTEIWGLYEITKVDCQGNVKVTYEWRKMFVVNRGHGTYSNADPSNGYVCNLSNIGTNQQGWVVCKRPG